VGNAFTRHLSAFFVGIVVSAAGASPAAAQWKPSGWEPPAVVTREEIVKASQAFLALPDVKIKEREEVIRIRAAEMDWDVGGMIFEPEDASKIPVGPDGKKVGIFMIHGGAGDHRGQSKIARLLAGKFGIKVVTMTYPGQLYLLDPSRNWPGKTINPDGSVRTPLWTRETTTPRSDYEVVQDKDFPKFGTMILACAKEGTEFYDRMASWPMAFEETGKVMMARYLPASDYSIYIHGHSTGGPFSFMFTQRIPNIVGVIGIENSPFGYISRVQMRNDGGPNGKNLGDLPFQCLHIRTWRDAARYAGIEALMTEGPDALLNLPVLMEKVLSGSENGQPSPSIKAQGPVHYGSTHQLAEMARATATRLKLDAAGRKKLIDQYVFYSRDMWGDDVKPVPPVLFGVVLTSGDHTPEIYRSVTLPMYAAMDPPPKVRLIEFKAGRHGYAEAETDLPVGTFPAVAMLWRDAIMNGYYLDYARAWYGKRQVSP
jgi:hypothetical protein